MFELTKYSKIIWTGKWMKAKWLSLTILQVPLAMAHFGFSEHPLALGQLSTAVCQIGNPFFFPSYLLQWLSSWSTVLSTAKWTQNENVLGLWCDVTSVVWERWGKVEQEKGACATKQLQYLGREQNQSWGETDKTNRTLSYLSFPVIVFQLVKWVYVLLLLNCTENVYIKIQLIHSHII